RPSPSTASVFGCCAATGIASRRCASRRSCASRFSNRLSENLAAAFMTIHAGSRGVVIAAVLAGAAAPHPHSHLDRARPAPRPAAPAPPTEATLHFLPP